MFLVACYVGVVVERKPALPHRRLWLVRVVWMDILWSAACATWMGPSVRRVFVWLLMMLLWKEVQAVLGGGSISSAASGISWALLEQVDHSNMESHGRRAL
jgi:hypothetical protein